MYRSMRFAARQRMFVLSSILLVLVSCTSSLRTTSAGADAPSATVAPDTGTLSVTSSPNPTSPASAAITIVTDRPAYATTDTIQAIVINHASATIYAASDQASCTILTLEILYGGQWQASVLAPCLKPPTVAILPIRPNIPYRAAIHGQAFPGRPQPLVAGTYRLTLAYWKTLTGAIPSPNDRVMLSSASFTIGS